MIMKPPVETLAWQSLHRPKLSVALELKMAGTDDRPAIRDFRGITAIFLPCYVGTYQQTSRLQSTPLGASELISQVGRKSFSTDICSFLLKFCLNQQ